MRVFFNFCRVTLIWNACDMQRATRVQYFVHCTQTICVCCTPVMKLHASQTSCAARESLFLCAARANRKSILSNIHVAISSPQFTQDDIISFHFNIKQARKREIYKVQSLINLSCACSNRTRTCYTTKSTCKVLRYFTIISGYRQEH